MVVNNPAIQYHNLAHYDLLVDYLPNDFDYEPENTQFHMVKKLMYDFKDGILYLKPKIPVTTS